MLGYSNFDFDFGVRPEIVCQPAQHFVRCFLFLGCRVITQHRLGSNVERHRRRTLWVNVPFRCSRRGGFAEVMAGQIAARFVLVRLHDLHYAEVEPSRSEFGILPMPSEIPSVCLQRQAPAGSAPKETSFQRTIEGMCTHRSEVEHTVPSGSWSRPPETAVARLESVRRQSFLTFVLPHPKMLPYSASILKRFYKNLPHLRTTMGVVGIGS
jgi:hypothetical protein